MSGPLLVVLGAGAWMAVALSLRTRLPVPVVTTLLAVSAMAVAAGGLLIQGEAVTTADWIVALALMALAGPFQARIGFGPFGENGRLASGTVGRD